MEIHKDIIESNHYSVFVLSDVHEGNAGHNETAFNLAISLIKETAKERTTEVLLNGDLIDCIEITDKRFNPVEISEKYKMRDLKDLPRKQADYVIEKLTDIKGLITDATVGNHEEAYIKDHHFDVYDYYCNALGIRKLGFAGIVRKSIHEGGKSRAVKVIDIGITHGRGGAGGKLAGYALNYCVDIWQKFRVDIGLVGHIHQLTEQSYPSLYVNQNLRLMQKTRWYGVCGCFLDTYIEGSSGYFEGRHGQVSAIGMLRIDVDRGNQGWKTQCNKINLDGRDSDDSN